MCFSTSVLGVKSLNERAKVEYDWTTGSINVGIHFYMKKMNLTGFLAL